MTIEKLFKVQNKIKYAVVSGYNLDPVEIYKDKHEGIYYFVNNSGQYIYLFGDEKVDKFVYKKGL